MTDDEDRMNRAKRIREMREGGRNSDDEQTDGSADGEPAEKTDSADDSAPNEDGKEAESETGDKQTIEELAESTAEEAAAENGADVDETDEIAEDVAVDDETDEITEENDDESETPAEGAVSEKESEPTDEEPEQPTADAGDPGEDGEVMETAETDGSTAPDDQDGVSAPLPDTEQLEEALGEADAENIEKEAPDAGPGQVVDADEAATKEAETRVLEFTLDDEHYCLGIEYIEEIVKEETITRVPNTPEFVQGVVDLRGQITTILNPKVTLGKDNTDADELIVVFDAEAFEDQGHIGWVVDDVRQVSPIIESEVNDPPMDADYINGVIDREDEEEFVIWTSPDLAFEEADG